MTYFKVQNIWRNLDIDQRTHHISGEAIGTAGDEEAEAFTALEEDSVNRNAVIRQQGHVEKNE